MSSEAPPTPGHGRRETWARALNRLKRTWTRRRSSRAQRSADTESVTEITTNLSDIQPATVAEQRLEPTDLKTTASRVLTSRRFGPEVLEIDDQPEEFAAEPSPREITVPVHRRQST